MVKVIDKEGILEVTVGIAEKKKKRANKANIHLGFQHCHGQNDVADAVGCGNHGSRHTSE